MAKNDVILQVENLQTHLGSREGTVKAVSGSTFQVNKGETLGIVGESGCGKTMTALSIMGLVPPQLGGVVGGSMVLDGEDLAQMQDAEIRKRRSTKMGMIFQDPATSLNPTMKVGPQIAETLQIHMGLDEKTARTRVIQLLDRVGIPSPATRYYEYPFQFSGGMRQRVMIAIALSCNPMLLIADEPTTALDVTVQAQLLELVKELQKEEGMSVIWITHDLGVVAELCDRVAVMYAGYIVETGSADDIFFKPKHRYTSSLLKSLPTMDKRSTDELASIPGIVPSLANLKPGCPFMNRCDSAVDKCAEDNPVLEEMGKNHMAACWNPVK
ncbi:MAG: peptide ABC transporter ATP-binding protein [Chloroflexi bacterium]|nr:peptide ABC transporter ATP-binding protein [Chloroflexota bacterium]